MDLIIFCAVMLVLIAFVQNPKRALAWVITQVLKLRYKVDIKGLEAIDPDGGNLILPNHTAGIDPVIIGAYLWTTCQARPVVSETYYHMPVVHQLMKFIRAIPMPDLQRESGVWKKQRMQKALAEIGNVLQAGDNVLLYPSGKLKTGPREVLGGAFGASLIMKNARDCKIVLVMIDGLYGSSFSTALSGGVSPDMKQNFKQAIGFIFKNLIFFTPKRTVTIRIEPAPADFPKGADNTVTNPWLEKYYNQGGDEKLTLVPYSMWSNELPQLEESKEDFGSISVPEEVMWKLRKQLSEMSRIPANEIRFEHKLAENLGLDSLSHIELMAWLDQEFAITDVESSDIKSVGAIAKVIVGHKPKVNENNQTVATNDGWLDVTVRPSPCLAIGSTITEQFLNTCDRMDKSPAVADDRTGVLDYKKLKIAVLAMAEEIRRLPGENIGIMLPASAGATIAIMASMLAGKVPVMLNWTMGTKNLEHVITSSGLERILTSEAFLDRIDVDVCFLEERFVFLEHVKASIGLAKKLKALYRSSKENREIINIFTGYHNDWPGHSDEIAIILFTSGSESAPKGVPLTHRNILSNIESTMQVIALESSDVIFGFLPPFHSFGLTVTTLLPLLSGLRVVFYPNPTESRKIADRCKKWGVSIMCGTPTFLSSILASGAKNAFDCLRLLVSGAEKAPDHLFKKAEEINPELRVLEGYGITECSPVVSATRMDGDRIGVGRPIPGVYVKIVGIEDMKPLPDGERGLILVRGDNIFNGYIGSKSDPFVEVDGNRYYNTGDLGIIQNGHLVLAGRLKRFIKIAGEMISLPAIEEALSAAIASGSEQEGPVIAVTAKESDDGSRPIITLFSTRPIDERSSNEILKKAGFPPLVNIKRVVSIDTIPLLGTGKTDYQKLLGLIPA